MRCIHKPFIENNQGVCQNSEYENEISKIQRKEYILEWCSKYRH